MRLFLLLLLLVPQLFCRGQINGQPGGVMPISLHPENEAFVKGYIQRFADGLLNLKKKNTEILDFIAYVLVANGVPKGMKNLAVIESSLNNRTVSSADAVGPWQFMPQTGRDFGLKVNQTVDERYDIYKSTFAASKMLKKLYARYLDWDLVVAAYNCGAGNVDKAIAQSGSRSFVQLQHYLPAESRNHVKKFIGASLVMDKNTLGGTGPVHERDSSRQDSALLASKGLAVEYIQAGFRSDKITAYLHLPPGDLDGWNKDLDNRLTVNGYFFLILPFDKMADFLFYKNKILQASIQQGVDNEK